MNMFIEKYSLSDKVKLQTMYALQYTIFMIQFPDPLINKADSPQSWFYCPKK